MPIDQSISQGSVFGTIVQGGSFVLVAFIVFYAMTRLVPLFIAELQANRTTFIGTIKDMEASQDARIDRFGSKLDNFAKIVEQNTSATNRLVHTTHEEPPSST